MCVEDLKPYGELVVKQVFLDGYDRERKKINFAMNILHSIAAGEESVESSLAQLYTHLEILTMEHAKIDSTYDKQTKDLLEYVSGESSPDKINTKPVLQRIK